MQPIQAGGYRILGYIQIAVGILTLTPTIHRIVVFGFESKMSPLIICSIAVGLSSLVNFREARRLEREKAKEQEKQEQTTPDRP